MGSRHYLLLSIYGAASLLASVTLLLPSWPRSSKSPSRRFRVFSPKETSLTFPKSRSESKASVRSILDLLVQRTNDSLQTRPSLTRHSVSPNCSTVGFSGCLFGEQSDLSAQPVSNVGPTTQDTSSSSVFAQKYLKDPRDFFSRRHAYDAFYPPHSFFTPLHPATTTEMTACPKWTERSLLRQSVFELERHSSKNGRNHRLLS